ncbi:MAG: c-type cytochrome [Verrucomicrobiales bacterium]
MWHRRWLLGLSVTIAVDSWAVPDAPLEAETYNQWKEALPGGQVTAAGEIRAPEGFTVELVRRARADEGSWVAMAFDPTGGIVVAREDRGLLRFDPSAGDGAPMALVETSLEEVRGLLWVGDALFANANNSRALCRLRDGDGDGKFEDVRVVRRTPGGVGHGRNQLALGPDGMIYSVHGDDVLPPEDGFSYGSPFAHAAEDHWLPLPWEKFNWSHSVRAPAGHVVRTDADGQRWEIWCGGLRNPFGIAFNADGELFTYDADIEWDVGLPWYRPTRVLHLVSGADYGWRGGFRALPAWMPDTAPAAVDIGKGSPTAIAFGYRSRFPTPWKEALFIMDWAYGVIYAVDLLPEGASYRGSARVFLQGRPLNVTGLEFGPGGALYFITGGRRTQSALYRVRWTGELPADADPQGPNTEATETRTLRRKLEAFHGRQSAEAVEVAWPHLRHADSWVRQAARVALEWQPPDQWIDRALKEPGGLGALTALLAAARTAGAETQPAVRTRLRGIGGDPLDEAEALLWARALQVSVLRHGPMDPGERTPWIATLDARFPHRSARVNRLLCELLCEFQAPTAIDKSLAWLETAPTPTQEDTLHVLLSLRVVEKGWTLETRRRSLNWLARARRRFVGAAALPTTLNQLRAAFLGSLTVEDRQHLASDLEALEVAFTPLPSSSSAPPRPFVKAWTVSDFANPPATPADPSRGRRIFVEASCATCHRAGSIEPAAAIGPDLTGVGQRFDHRALIESLLDPWKVIAPQYRIATVTLKNGAIHEGPVVAESESSLTLATNPVEPDSKLHLPRSDIADIIPRSAMAPGLLNSFSHQDILDLTAWLQAGAR